MMTIRTASVLLDYASFYVAGSMDVDVPMEHDADGIFGSDECLVVTGLPWNEGETRITLGRFDEIPTQPRVPDFDLMLRTPDQRVLLFDVNMPEILSMDVPRTQTRIRIWANRTLCPDDVIIALG